MPRRRRRRKSSWPRRLLLVVAAIPLAYLAAALAGSLIPVNRGWSEPDEGVTVYLANNGLHSDIVMPVKAQGLDWAPFVPKAAFAAPDAEARWIASDSAAGDDFIALLDGRDRRLVIADALLLRADHQHVEDDEDQEPRREGEEDS